MKALNRSKNLSLRLILHYKDSKMELMVMRRVGEPIGLKRLMARPVATLSIEAQERHERDEKIFVDD